MAINRASDKRSDENRVYYYDHVKPANMAARRVDVLFRALPDSVLSFVFVHGEKPNRARERAFISRIITSEFVATADIRNISYGSWYDNFGKNMMKGYNRYFTTRKPTGGVAVASRAPINTANDIYELETCIATMIEEEDIKWVDQLMLGSIIAAVSPSSNPAISPSSCSS